jgi:prolipoprotein diacylglyceryltransferase
MFPVINIGPLAIQSFGFILLLGVWLGLTWSERNAKRFDIEPELIFTSIFIIGLAAVLGARIGYVLIHFDLFLEKWTDIFSLNLSLMDFSSGVLAGIVFTLIHFQRKKISIWQYLDSMVPFFLVMNTAYAIATFANQTAIGMETTLPWGLLVYEKIRHPVQIYHLISALVLAALFIPNYQAYLGIPKKYIKPGGYFSLFLFVFSFLTGIIQTFRLEYPILFANINTFHLIGFLLILFAIWQSNRRILFPEEDGEYSE